MRPHLAIIIAAAVAATGLAACKTAPASPAIALEQVDVDAANLYGQIGVVIDSYEAAHGQTTASVALRNKAWSAFVAANAVYHLGQSVDLSQLTALLAQVKGL